MPAMTIEPRPRQWLPPSPEQQAAAAASAATFRAEQEERRAIERPLREAMVAALAEHGIVLRDPPATLDCPCGCHPRLDLGAHGGAGQAGCSCQQTPEERRAAVQQLFASRAEVDPQQEQTRTEEREALAARAAALGVHARIAVGGAPFVLAGTVDGRGFYLRERHDLWRVTVAPDADPGIDPWTADPSVLTLDIADGDAARLLADDRFSVVRTLDMAVGAVRSFLRQRECEHGRAQPGDRFCPACGTALVTPELP
jgi:hypothetical protein